MGSPLRPSGVPAPETSVAVRMVRRDWARIWEAKGERDESLVALDGYDRGMGAIDAKIAERFRTYVREVLGLNGAHRLLEVGCGAGLILGPLGRSCGLSVGVDLAFSILKRARGFWPNLYFVRGEGHKLPIVGSGFDRVLCFSVVQYFPDASYARSAVTELLRVACPGGLVLIGDVPDLSKREICEQARRAALAAQPTEHQEAGAFSLEPPHLYYSKEAFTSWVGSVGRIMWVRDQSIEGYGNSPYRFNLLIGKE